MPVDAGEYAQILKASKDRPWVHAEGESEGVDEIMLRKQEDGSYTHLLRIRRGVEMREPVVHEFYEEAFYIDGEMLNRKTNKVIRGGTYVYHEPGEPHGPFKCLKTCVILEFRYYK